MARRSGSCPIEQHAALRDELLQKIELRQIGGQHDQIQVQGRCENEAVGESLAALRSIIVLGARQDPGQHTGGEPCLGIGTFRSPVRLGACDDVFDDSPVPRRSGMPGIERAQTVRSSARQTLE